MSYKAQGIQLAYELNAAFAADRTKGQLVGMDTKSTLVHTGGLMKFPLVEDVKVVGVDANSKPKSVGVAVAGVAMVYVEAFAGITVGKQVGVGATGVGIANLAAAGQTLGIALETPTANGQIIPVMLSYANTSQYY